LKECGPFCAIIIDKNLNIITEGHNMVIIKYLKINNYNCIIMNYIILIICSVILPIISLKDIKPKLCINCKYFIPDNDSGKFGKCFLCPTSKGKTNFLVNGIINIDDYYSCSTARDEYVFCGDNSLCGKEAKYYKKKIIKNGHLKQEKM
jgi:hypothetical protein